MLEQQLLFFIFYITSGISVIFSLEKEFWCVPPNSHENINENENFRINMRYENTNKYSKSMKCSFRIEKVSDSIHLYFSKKSLRSSRKGDPCVRYDNLLVKSKNTRPRYFCYDEQVDHLIMNESINLTFTSNARDIPTGEGYVIFVEHLSKNTEQCPIGFDFIDSHYCGFSSSFEDSWYNSQDMCRQSQSNLFGKSKDDWTGYNSIKSKRIVEDIGRDPIPSQIKSQFLAAVTEERRCAYYGVNLKIKLNDCFLTNHKFHCKRNMLNPIGYYPNNKSLAPPPNDNKKYLKPVIGVLAAVALIIMIGAAYWFGRNHFSCPKKSTGNDTRYNDVRQDSESLDQISNQKVGSEVEPSAPPDNNTLPPSYDTIFMNFLIPFFLCQLFWINISDIIDGDGRMEWWKDFVNFKNNFPILTKNREESSISVHFNLLSIDEINSQRLFIDGSFMMEMKWTDDRLNWNRSLYGNLTEMDIPSHLIWTPLTEFSKQEFLNIRQHELRIDESEKLPHSCRLESSGNISMSHQMRMAAMCQNNFLNFPFDEMHCMFQFPNLKNYEYKLNLNELDKLDELSMMKENDTNFHLGTDIGTIEWNITKTISNGRHLIYLNLKRRNSFFSLIFLLPTMLCILIVIATFLLSPEDGERLTLCIINFLIISIILIMIEFYLPIGISIPHIVSFNHFLLVIILIQLAFSIYLFNLTKRTDSQIILRSTTSSNQLIVIYSQIKKWTNNFIFYKLSKFVFLQSDVIEIMNNSKSPYESSPKPIRSDGQNSQMTRLNGKSRRKKLRKRNERKTFIQLKEKHDQFSSTNHLIHPSSSFSSSSLSNDETSTTLNEETAIVDIDLSSPDFHSKPSFNNQSINSENEVIYSSLTKRRDDKNEKIIEDVYEREESSKKKRIYKNFENLNEKILEKLSQRLDRVVKESKEFDYQINRLKKENFLFALIIDRILFLFYLFIIAIKLLKIFEENSNFIKFIEPVEINQIFPVYIHLKHLQFLDIDDFYAIFNFKLELKWIDQFHQWNPSNYSSITFMEIDEKFIWTPNLLIYHGEFVSRRSDIQISSNGEVKQIVFGTIKLRLFNERISLRTHIKFYHLIITSPMGSHMKLNLFDNRTVTKVDDQISSLSSWIVSDGIEHIFPYREKDQYILTLNLERNGSIYHWTLHISGIASFILATIIFILPTYRRERIVIGLFNFIIILLSLLSIEFQSKLSRSSWQNSPFIYRLLYFSLLANTTSIILSIFISSISSNSTITLQCRAPFWLRHLFFTRLSTYVCLWEIRLNMRDKNHLLQKSKERCRNDEEFLKRIKKNSLLISKQIQQNSKEENHQNFKEENHQHSINRLLYMMAKSLHHWKMLHVELNEERCQIDIEWYLISLILDRFLFFLYIIIIIGGYFISIQ
ncbi:hypothetical protein SNEBB_008699 [Seison nebaliae]|nr:hypothetical protein SNEBB_008699 [Seison nebaliae]